MGAILAALLHLSKLLSESGVVSRETRCAHGVETYGVRALRARSTEESPGVDKGDEREAI